MRKLLTIALTTIFLISGVGFGSSQHYCQVAQKTMAPGEMDCCSNEPEPQAQSKDACCELEDDGQPSFTQTEGFSGSCCILQQTYKQVDVSAKLQQPDLGHTTCALNGQVPTPQQINTGESQAQVNSSHPATYQNLPLLI